MQQQLQPVRGVGRCERNSCRHQGPCTRRGRRCSSYWGRDSPAAPGEDHGEAAGPPQPVEVHGRALTHLLQPVEDPTLEQLDVSKGGCGPEGSLCWCRFLAGPADSWGGVLAEARFAGRTCDPIGSPSLPEGLHSVERTHAGAVHDLQPVGRIHTGEVCRGLSQVRGTPRWSRGRV